jgi:hypothetical protein
LKRAYALAILLVISGALVFGCITTAQPPSKDAVYGYKFFDFNKAHYWKMNVTMSASGVNATWDMAVRQNNETINGSILRHFQVDTIGNGMNITYDIWSNATTYEVVRMHAKGAIGDFYQDTDTSTLQIYTLPDFGIIYYLVPLSPLRNVTVSMPDGNTATAYWYAATDNKGYTIAYLANPNVPVPLEIKTIDKNYEVTSRLMEYQ